MVGGALLGAAANRQVCPTISEMTFGNQSRFHRTHTPISRNCLLAVPLQSAFAAGLAGLG